MAVAKSFRDLNVYKLSRETAGAIFTLSKMFPKEERYSLTDQVRRSSRATGAMIAEVWARRRYKAAFINKLDEALGETMETQVWLDHALDCDYLSQSDFKKLNASCDSVGAMLSRMIDRASDFCKHSADADYRVTARSSGTPITNH